MRKLDLAWLLSKRPMMLAVAVLAAGLAALACGGSATTAPPVVPATEAPAPVSPVEGLDPCTLITLDEATTFFGGVAPNPGIPVNDAGIATCTYITADAVNSVFVTVKYYDKGALASSDEFTVLKSSESQDVPGLGDAAYRSTSQLDHTLYVAKGPWLIKINGNAQGAPATLEKLTAVAANVLARLP